MLKSDKTGYQMLFYYHYLIFIHVCYGALNILPLKIFFNEKMFKKKKKHALKCIFRAGDVAQQ